MKKIGINTYIEAVNRYGFLVDWNIPTWAAHNQVSWQTIKTRRAQNHDGFLTPEEIVGTIPARHRPPREHHKVEAVEDEYGEKFIFRSAFLSRRLA